MEITLKGDPKEITALVVALQARSGKTPEDFIEEFIQDPQ